MLGQAQVRGGPDGAASQWRSTMSAKERPMPPAEKPTPPDKREEIHRAQLSLVAASLRAGVQYTRPGRVGKAAPKRA
jgi:hypothetical protein